jgi:hypothetical protein
MPVCLSDWFGEVIVDEKDAVKLTLSPGDGRKRPLSLTSPKLRQRN